MIPNFCGKSAEDPEFLWERLEIPNFCGKSAGGPEFLWESAEDVSLGYETSRRHLIRGTNEPGLQGRRRFSRRLS